MSNAFTLPLIHSNGTGKQTLCDGYDSAANKLEDFITAWGSIEFNARDYYPLSVGAWEEARDGRNAMNLKIREIRDYITAHRMEIHK